MSEWKTIDYGDDVGRLKHLLALREDQLHRSHKKWIEAAELAIAGDFGPLRNRVELSKVAIEWLERSQSPPQTVSVNAAEGTSKD